MNMKKTRMIILSALVPVLLSCRNANLSPCYQCYMGKMYLSDATKTYDSIKNHYIQDDVTDFTASHYGDNYLINDTNDLDRFRKTEGISLPESEYLTVKEKIKSEYVEYFFVQIPSGYKALKRNNVQGYIRKDEGQILLTDNLFYYEPKKEEIYCLIDIKKDETVASPYVFSFYFSIPTELIDVLKNGSTRLIYHDADTKENQSE